MVSKNVNFGPSNPDLPYTATFGPAVQVMGGRMGDGAGEGEKGGGRREKRGREKGDKRGELEKG